MKTPKQHLRAIRQRNYWLAETVMLPAMDMPPEMVMLRCRPAGFARGLNAIEITAVHRDWISVTKVLTKDVAAIFIPRNAKKPESGIDNPSRWMFGDRITAYLNKRSTFARVRQRNRPGPDAVAGRVYIDRQARVMMNVEFAGSASCAAEYFPEYVYMSGHGQSSYGDCRANHTDYGPCRSRGDC